jgi:hypothetical protein
MMRVFKEKRVILLRFLGMARAGGSLGFFFTGYCLFIFSSLVVIGSKQARCTYYSGAPRSFDV